MRILTIFYLTVSQKSEPNSLIIQANVGILILGKVPLVLTLNQLGYNIFTSLSCILVCKYLRWFLSYLKWFSPFPELIECLYQVPALYRYWLLKGSRHKNWLHTALFFSAAHTDYKMLSLSRMWREKKKLIWKLSAAAAARLEPNCGGPALISEFQQTTEAWTERISALLPDTGAECPFRELTTRTTFRNDTSRCYLRAPRSSKPQQPNGPNPEFPFDQSVYASSSHDPAAISVQPTTFKRCRASAESYSGATHPIKSVSRLAF